MKAKSLLCFVLLVRLVFPTATQAKEALPRFERISTGQGLSQVTIYCILQDSRGLMWFGTEDGLNSYDGYTFTIYKRDPEDIHSLSANTIRAIYEDAAGMLWIGTDGSGLNLFDRRTEQFIQYRHDPDNPDSLSGNTVTAIYEDASGKLWIGTDGAGLNQLDRATGRFSHFRYDPNTPTSLSNDTVTAILGGPAGELWIGTSDGLNQLDPAASFSSDGTPLSRTFVHYKNNPQNPNSLSNNSVTALFLDHAGLLWIGTDSGLNELDPNSGAFTRYRHSSQDLHSLSANEVMAIHEDSSDVLWVGTPDGLNELDQQRRAFVRYMNDPHNPNSLSHSIISAIYEDSSGILWIGTTVGGLNKLDRKTRRFVHYSNDPTVQSNVDDSAAPSSNTIWALLEDSQGALWVGMSGASNGLDRLDRQTGEFTHYLNDPLDASSLPPFAVVAVYEDSTGSLWVGAYEGGLHRLNLQSGSPPTGIFTHYRHNPADPTSLSNDTVWAFLEDSRGRFWVGTMGGGLNLLDRQSGKLTHYLNDLADPDSLSSNYILYLYEDRAGTIWVGTTQGLDRLVESGAAGQPVQKFVHFRNDPADPRSLSSNAVPAIYEDASGVLWIGTDDGLNRLDPATDTFTHYTENDGLANDAIACILGDEQGYLWISSGKGLSKFDPRSEQFKNYDVRDGLQSDEFNRGACDQNAQGEMFFGGINGFNIFKPVDIADNPHVPPVVLTGFQIFNKPVPIGGSSPLQQSIGETKSIILPYQDYAFSFEFAALDYTIPSKNQYAYKLEGFDRQWIKADSRRRFASYANLPAGAYTFRVRGSNNDGVWNENGVALEVIVTPPPWKTWWAYTLYVLLGISIIAAIWRYRSREIARKHLEQTMWAVQSERDRIAALLESRRQLVVSLSHDLRTPVTIMRSQLEATNGKPWQSHLPELEVLTQELDRLQGLLDDLFTLSRLDVEHLTIRLVPVDVVKVARKVVEAISIPAWKQSKVEVTLETSQAELWVTADEQRLQQVLMNLLHNAVRHTLPGGIVMVGLNETAETISIRVQDTGEGISPADLPKVWERFYRGQSQAGGGAGLGLALVKELTEAMGGSVAVQSVLGEGSCFTVTWPRAASI